MISIYIPRNNNKNNNNNDDDKNDDDNNDNNECPICFEIVYLYNSYKLKCCKYRVHNDCIIKWYSNKKSNKCFLCQKTNRKFLNYYNENNNEININILQDYTKIFLFILISIAWIMYGFLFFIKYT